MFGDDFEPVSKTLEFDYQRIDLKNVKTLSIEDNLLYYKWLVGHSTEAKKEA